MLHPRRFRDMAATATKLFAAAADASTSAPVAAAGDTRSIRNREWRALPGVPRPSNASFEAAMQPLKLLEDLCEGNRDMDKGLLRCQVAYRSA